MRCLLAALLLTSLAPPALSQPSTLTVGLREDPDVLDPTLGSAYVSRVVYASMCDKLIDIDAGLNLVPQLATSWEYEDPVHLVLHLRPGVVFHDGEPFDAEAVRYKPKLKVAIGDGLAYQGITFNTGNGPAADTALGRSRLVRQAFERAIDRDAANQVVYGGLFSPTAQASPRSSPFFVPDVQPPPRDLARARALLKEAGVTLPVPVTLTLPNSPDVQQTAEVIQAMVAEAGFDLKLRVMEFASSLQAGYGGEFQAYLIGWSGRSDPDGNVWQQLHTGGTFNYGHWSSPAADALLDQARIPSDPAERRALYAKLWDVERADLPLIYLWTAKNVVGMKRGLDGFVQVPDGLIRLRGVTLGR